MDAPHHQDDSRGASRVFVQHVDGDAIFVTAEQATPHIPAGKGRHCPQCSRTAWSLSRHCWHCRFDFARTGRWRTASKLLFLTAVANLAAAIAWVLTHASLGNL